MFGVQVAIHFLCIVFVRDVKSVLDVIVPTSAINWEYCEKIIKMCFQAVSQLAHITMHELVYAE